MGLAGQVYRRLEPRMPDGVKPLATSLRGRRADLRQRRRRQRAEGALRAYLTEVGGNLVRDVDPGPPWTRELVLQTAVQHESRVGDLLNPDRYLASGYEMTLRYLRVAEAHGFNLRTARAAYEMGCGSGRLIRHLRAVSGLRLVGSDLGETSTAWCRANLPGIEFYRNEPGPPLDFAEDDAFDLAIASSVFTHIPLDGQDAWLAEINRVTRPGGYFLCTVEGAVKQREMLTPEDLAALEAEGSLCLDATSENVSLSTRVTGTWDVFLLRPQVLALFGRHFDVLDYLPGNQDLVVARVPPAGTAPTGWPPPSDGSRPHAAAALWV